MFSYSWKFRTSFGANCSVGDKNRRENRDPRSSAYTKSDIDTKARREQNEAIIPLAGLAEKSRLVSREGSELQMGLSRRASLQGRRRRA